MSQYVLLSTVSTHDAGGWSMLDSSIPTLQAALDSPQSLMLYSYSAVEVGRGT